MTNIMQAAHFIREIFSSQTKNQPLTFVEALFPSGRCWCRVNKASNMSSPGVGLIYTIKSIQKFYDTRGRVKNSPSEISINISSCAFQKLQMFLQGHALNSAHSQPSTSCIKKDPHRYILGTTFWNSDIFFFASVLSSCLNCRAASLFSPEH